MKINNSEVKECKQTVQNMLMLRVSTAPPADLFVTRLIYLSNRSLGTLAREIADGQECPSSGLAVCYGARVSFLDSQKHSVPAMFIRTLEPVRQILKSVQERGLRNE